MLETKKIKTELCIVGGGMAGMNAAITAARLGVKVVIVQERPVFGGNASSEIRMWICGTQNYEYRETGLSEEINLENMYYNPDKNYYLWDALLYGKIQNEPNITPLLNCTCFNAVTGEVDGNGRKRILSVTAYQMTTQTLFEIEAELFADCSGDSILAPLTGAEFMYGRESRAEYDEPMRTHEERDNMTMGNSCLIQARKICRNVSFRAPDWAEKVPAEKLKSKSLNLYRPSENFWYLELGGVSDTISCAENINKRLIALCLGVWDTIKNSGEFDADEFELEFIGFLGAKRESRRMRGEYVLTANDIIEGKVFDDTVAYGGWPLDDHNPEGFDGVRSNYTIAVNKPYGIPYRCLYSVNIDNLFFAGRNISATHMAMSSARVMGTCSIIGQAVGAAAYAARKYRIAPRDVGSHIREVQQLLLMNDCFLPGIEREVSSVCKGAELSGADNRIRSGADRDLGGKKNGVLVENGREVKYVFGSPVFISGVKLVFDSDLERNTFQMDNCEKHHSMRANILEDSPTLHMPLTLAKEYEVRAILGNGEGICIRRETGNIRRNILLEVNAEVSEISLVIYGNWGDTPSTNLFTFELF